MTVKAARLFAIVALARCLVAQESGVVQGRVIDEHGAPIDGAQVHLAERNERPGPHLLNIHETDAHGQFIFEHMPLGPYSIIVNDAKDGYADMTFAFNSNLQVPTITLTSETPTAAVTVRLGPKAGLLRLSAIDAITGKELTGAVTLRRAANPDLYVTTSTTERPILVPSTTRVTISVGAEGYQDWYYPGVADPTRSRSIELNPEETMQVRAYLTRLPGR